MTDPRYLAVKLLDKTFVSDSYSNLQLDSGLKNSDLDERGRKLRGGARQMGKRWEGGGEAKGREMGGGRRGK